jgi:uncharacterized membrane protein YkvA (DUF1232 family)
VKIQVKEHLRHQRPWDVVHFASHIPSFGRLFLALFADRRVSPFAKAMLASALLYVVSPFDFLPDMMPLMGQVDDLGIFLTACRMFIQLCPQEVVQEHVARIDATGKWTPFA